MVWPITGAEFYVSVAGKSMKVRELAVSRRDGWRKIAIALIPARAPQFRRYEPDKGLLKRTA